MSLLYTTNIKAKLRDTPIFALDLSLKVLIIVYIVVLQMVYNKGYLSCTSPAGKASISQATYGAFDWNLGSGEAKIVDDGVCSKAWKARDQHSDFYFRDTTFKVNTQSDPVNVIRLVPHDGWSYCAEPSASIQVLTPCDFLTYVQLLNRSRCKSRCYYGSTPGAVLLQAGTDLAIVEWSRYVSDAPGDKELEFLAGAEDMYLQIVLSQVTTYFIDSGMADSAYGGTENTMEFTLCGPSISLGAVSCEPSARNDLRVFWYFF